MSASALVLIVDDEPMIRLVLRRTLEGAGYRVVEATNGREALSIVAHDLHGIAVVFSDVSMPHMDGFELASALRRLAPRVPVVLTSGGYSSSGEVGSSQRSGPPVLAKPYSRDEVLTAISGAITPP